MCTVGIAKKFWCLLSEDKSNAHPTLSFLLWDGQDARPITPHTHKPTHKLSYLSKALVLEVAALELTTDLSHLVPLETDASCRGLHEPCCGNGTYTCQYEV